MAVHCHTAQLTDKNYISKKVIIVQIIFKIISNRYPKLEHYVAITAKSEIIIPEIHLSLSPLNFHF
jgi:hypothetical protein